MRRWIPILIAGLPFLGALKPPPYATKEYEEGVGGGVVSLDFANDVQPILKAHCLPCHNGESAAAGLDFSTAAGIQKGGASGPAFIAGKSKTSLIVRRLRGLDGLPSMPMGFKPIDEAKIRTVERWIDGGASFSGPKRIHWAYLPPVSPKVPQPKNAKLVRNPIDTFVLLKLEREGLKFSPEADHRTLIRRLSLDLTGLPPTIEETQAFLADKRPDAYERLVDRLLASPAYGERQARMWLDLARYADTNGFEADRTRIMWPYRDWVIRAFNRNLPYDQFTIEQLAGDLLPKPTQDQIVASGFNRNAMFNEEGGTDAGEQLFYVLLDRVATTSTAFLGSTVGCARCHDHKYDPFTQKDHYAMLAFFNGTDAKLEGDPKVGQARYIEPTMPFESAEQKERKLAIEKRLAQLEVQLSAPNPARELARRQWLDRISAPVSSSSLKPASMKAQSEAAFEAGENGVILVSGANPAQDVYTISVDLAAGTNAIIVETVPNASFANGGPGRSSSGNIVLTKFEIRIANQSRKLAMIGADFTQQGYDPAVLGEGDANSGWALYPDVKRNHFLTLQFEKPLEASVRAELVLEFKSPWPQHALGSFRLLATDDPFPMRRNTPSSIVDVAKRSSRSSDEERVLNRYFDSIWTGRIEQSKLQRQLEAELRSPANQPIPLLVMRDKPGLKEYTTPMYKRGEYLSPMEPVSAATPAFLPKMAPGLPRNRLGLAKWIVDPSNPLTARVQVNRMWEQYFGRGIVESLDDLGTQCSPPDNQGLLDWMAVMFMKSGWDMKAMHKLIVTSATYRQSSNATKALLVKDPENRLLARGPRFRMEAEMLRDQALAVSGLLSKKIGGPSVFPYQPEGIWDSPYSGERWMQSAGADRHRRSLYTFWKRTATYPAFTTMDASSRESCTPRRIRTNTPLQALALLNDPVYVEAARALAERSMGQARGSKPSPAIFDPVAAIGIAFAQAVGRPASKVEVDRLMKVFTASRTGSKSRSADLDALALVCSVILNLDEVQSKS